MKQNLVRYILGLLILVVLLGHSIGVYQIDLVSRLEAIAYDSKVRLTMPETRDDRIVIVDIDEKSLAEQGRWPWGRDKLATLVNKLFDQQGIAVVGFDVVFAEADESSGLKSLEALAKTEFRDNDHFQATVRSLRPHLDNDARFAEAIKNHRVVLGYPFSNSENGVSTGVLPSPVLKQSDFGVSAPLAATFASYGGNLEKFQSVAAGAGHFVPLTDLDGVSRRVPMLANYQGSYYESLSLAIVRAIHGFPKLKPGYPDAGSSSGRQVEWLEMATSRGTMTVPVDETLATLIPFRGYAGSFRYVSATDILNDRLPAGFLTGKVILVGTTAPGLLDLRATPVDGIYPGVEVHANLIAGMLDGTLKHRPAYVKAIDLMLLLIAAGVMIFYLPLLSPARATAITVAVLLIIIAINLILWHYSNLLVPQANVVILMAALFALNMSWGYFVESRSKRQFTELFGQYVPPELVDEMAKNPESYSMVGRKAELTVLFSDVRGFTTISESLQPDELATLMNEYLGAMTVVVRHHRGTLDKYIGDAIMAFWGAPVDDEQHALNAVVTALDMQTALLKLNTELASRGWPELKIGVGVNTGLMTVGDMGSSVRKSYTVMGDAVNLGSRIEGITKQYGVGILVGERTRELLRKEIVFREVDRVRVKGKEAPVGIYEPLGLEGQLTSATLDELKLWNQTLRAYRAQDWDQAELGLMNLQRINPHYLYQLYAERLAHYRKLPPGEGWDGVTTFETK